MDLAAFRRSLAAQEPPAEAGPAAAAMWRAAKGEWEAAHTLAQAQEDATGAWVHAHLHRIEGDEANAGYWYRRAGKPHCADPLDEEWTAIVKALLAP